MQSVNFGARPPREVVDLARQHKVLFVALGAMLIPTFE
jgi:predicted metal-dependent phosphoesterase TrpH